MAEITGIAWCDHTFNPWIGCTKVSAACDFCYAEALMDHRHHRVTWGGERSLTSDDNWAQPYRWNKKAKQDGVRRKVFCASLADVFDNQVPETWRSRLWAVIDACRDLDWLLLTKRPQNIAKMLPDGIRPWGEGAWPNVWLGTTAENQTEWDRRWPHLRKVPAAVHFISIEPQLSEVFFRPDKPGWVICGGESGPKARLFDIAWARDLRDQCAEARVPFFMKQFGSNPVGISGITGKGDDPSQWPDDLRVREFPIVRRSEAADG